MSSLFITGTDTGVGKTAIACGLAAWCRDQGISVGVMKPVATGARRVHGAWVSDDTRQLIAASGSRDPAHLISPAAYRAPLAPLVAARREGRAVPVAAIVTAYHALCRRHRMVLVEGIGGALVPLTDRLTAADLARRLGLRAIIVARAGLGTINHTLLTVEALRRRRVPVAAVILNAGSRREASGLAGRTNPAALRRLLRVPILGPVPFTARAQRADPAWLERALGRQALRRLILGARAGSEKVD